MSLWSEMASFFDGFVAAFGSFDGDRIAGRYQPPYLALHVDGSRQVFADQAEVGRYFQRVVDDYHGKGCRSCRYGDLDAFAIGSRSALATVTWDLLREDGSVIGSWRESYGLTRTDGGWRIFSSVDHAA